jgi:hypothetical protein
VKGSGTTRCSLRAFAALRHELNTTYPPHGLIYRTVNKTLVLLYTPTGNHQILNTSVKSTASVAADTVVQAEVHLPCSHTIISACCAMFKQQCCSRYLANQGITNHTAENNHNTFSTAHK